MSSGQLFSKRGIGPCTAVLAAVAGVLGPSFQATASEEFRCGSHLVEVGMSLDKVRDYCGEPTEQTGDRWIYDRGPDQLVVVVHVHPDYTVALIETRPRD